jgi:ABC-type molybdate transport system substrate-binding protein
MKAFAGILMAAMLPMSALAQAPLSVYAAGSLRAPLTAIATAWRNKTGIEVRFTFGASGLLKERIEKGEPADVFASANSEHPQALSGSGLAHPAHVFTRNEMCVLTTPKIQVTPATLLEVMLDPAIKLGTSTPQADPSGDYAWLIFDKAEKLRSGSFARLDAKALKLTGGPSSPPPPANRSVYGELVASGQADLFLTYCSNALLAVAEQPGLRQLALPSDLAVGASYGMVVLKQANPQATEFARYLLGPEAKAVFLKYGFGAITPAGG